MSTSCSGSGSETPPRAASRASRSSPTSRRSGSVLVGGPVVDRALGLLVGQLGPSSAPAPARRGRRCARPGRSSRIVHSSAGRTWSGSSDAGVLAEHLRVQRDLRVGAVQRLAAPVGLDVDRVAGRDERGDVGDRVVHDVAVTVALEVQRLVEVAGTPAGSMVTKARSVRSRSGSRGARAAAARPPPRPPAGSPGVTAELRLDRRDALRAARRRPRRPRRTGPGRRGCSAYRHHNHRVDPVAAQRGQVRAASRQAARPVDPRLPRPDPGPRAGPRRPGRAVRGRSGGRREDARHRRHAGATSSSSTAPCARRPTARADQVYSGVLYDALDVATLSAAAKRRATARLAVTSSLFGMVRPRGPDPGVPTLRRRHPAGPRRGRRRLARAPRRRC